MRRRGQLWALVRLRLAMVRSPWRRGVLVVLLLLLPLIAAWCVVAGQLAPRDFQLDVRTVAPTLFAAYAVIALIAPLAAGGALELFPSDQLVAFPVRASTLYWGGLALTPLNVAWLAQTCVLLGAMSYAGAGTGADWTAVVAGLCWAAACTSVGATLAWIVVGVRQGRVGRAVTRAALVVVLAAAGAVVLGGRLADVLDQLPTLQVVARALLLPGREWLGLVASMLAVAGAALLAGPRVCAWALRRVGDRAAAPESRTYARREPPASTTSLLARTDRASVWRSPALRRGVVLLAVLPALVGSLTRLTWTGLVLIPGLVAAGAGLLFAINVFCLDGSGAVWLASLPHDPRSALVGKARALAEACAVPLVVALATGAVSTRSVPSAAQLVTVLVTAVTAVLVVAARCLRLSVTRPHRADLRGPRDTPAPPGAMALASADLAARTTLLALYLSLAPLLGPWWAAPLMALPVLLATTASLLGSWRRWADPAVRARVVSQVAFG